MRWCLTIKRSDFDKNALQEIFTSKIPAKLLVCAPEVGDGETLYEHWQIYVEFQKRLRFSTIKKACPRAHVQRSRGTRQQNIRYCLKQQQHPWSGDAEKCPYLLWGLEEPEVQALLELEYKENTADFETDK